MRSRAAPASVMPGDAVGCHAMAVVRGRLIPFMFLLYIVSYLDRINVGFAALQMNRDLHFSDAVYGFGAGVFFIGYFLFEIPSNLILHRVGARTWIARIMITWGVLAAAMMFVRTERAFYVMRFLLGLAEAGFFPGMLLYLSRWFPATERARAIALFMTATAVAGVIGGPISGALLGLQGVAGFTGWQWMFLLEGLPAVILAVVVLVYLTERPEEASWLSAEERVWIVEQLRREREASKQEQRLTIARALTSGRIWACCMLYFLLVTAMYGIAFWLPQIIRAWSDRSNFVIGLASAVPYLVAAVAMPPIGRHSDATGERRWHVAVCCLVAAAALIASTRVQAPMLGLLSLSCAAVGIWGALAPFWALPMGVLSGSGAAAGLALINSVGNLGGFVGPYAIGLIKNMTDSFSGGLFTIAGALACAAAVALAIPHKKESGTLSGVQVTEPPISAA